MPRRLFLSDRTAAVATATMTSTGLATNSRAKTRTCCDVPVRKLSTKRRPGAPAFSDAVLDVFELLELVEQSQDIERLGVMRGLFGTRSIIRLATVPGRYIARPERQHADLERLVLGVGGCEGGEQQRCNSQRDGGSRPSPTASKSAANNVPTAIAGLVSVVEVLRVSNRGHRYHPLHTTKNTASASNVCVVYSFSPATLEVSANARILQ